MEIRHLLLAVLAPDVGRNVVHRPGAEESDHRRKVEDRRRLQLLDVAPHARRLKLEHARRLARRQQLEGGGVLQRQPVEVDLDASLLLDEVDGLAQDGQVGEPQEVELQQAQRLDAVHLVLGHQPVGVRRVLQRHQLRQRLAADDHAGRVRGRVARDALELVCQVKQPLDVGVGVAHLSQRRCHLERFLELDAELDSVWPWRCDPPRRTRSRARGRRPGWPRGRASCRT